MDDWKSLLREGIKPLLSVLVDRGFDRLEERIRRFERLFIRGLLGVLVLAFGIVFLTLGGGLALTRIGIPLDLSLLGFALLYLLLGGILLRQG